MCVCMCGSKQQADAVYSKIYIHTVSAFISRSIRKHSANDFAGEQFKWLPLDLENCFGRS